MRLQSFHSGSQGNAGFVITTPGSDYDDLYSVAALDDVNGDDIPDVDFLPNTT